MPLSPPELCALPPNLPHNRQEHNCLRHKLSDLTAAESLIPYFQGDEPMIDPQIIDDLVGVFNDDAVQMATVASTDLRIGDCDDKNTVKVKIDKLGNAIGFKRIIQELKVPLDAKFVFYKPYGIDSLFTSSISNFPLPDGHIPAQKTFAQKEIKSNEFYQVVR